MPWAVPPPPPPPPPKAPAAADAAPSGEQDEAQLAQHIAARCPFVAGWPQKLRPRSVYVEGVPPSVDMEELRSLLERVGTVRDLVLLRDANDAFQVKGGGGYRTGAGGSAGLWEGEGAWG